MTIFGLPTPTAPTSSREKFPLFPPPTNNLSTKKIEIAIPKYLQKTLKKVIEDLLHNEVTKLDLSSRGIDDTAAKILALALQVNYSLKTLNLSSNSITEKGAKELKKALEENRTLKELILNHNKIDQTLTKQLVGLVERKKEDLVKKITS